MPLVNPFEHVISEFRIPPNQMPSLSSPSLAPSYQSIRTFQKALNHNAMSISSTQTPLGHLHLVISNEKYLQASENKPFKVPSEPDLVEATADVTPGAVTRAMFDLSSSSSTDPTSDTLQAIKAFELQQQTHLKYVATVVALRNLILWSSYGTVDDADHAANEDAMKKPWSPPEPIATLFDQLKRGQEFAARGNEIIDDTQLIRWGYQNIKNTGLFNRECEKWRKKDSSAKAWSDFKKHFILAFDDHLKYDSLPAPATTAAEATYTANQVQQILHDELSTILGSNAPPDTLSPDDPPPFDPDSGAANAAITIDDVRRVIQETLASATPHQSRSRTTTPSTPLVGQGFLRGKPVSYCWTHGVTSNLRHTSSSCRRKATGHKNAATFSNRMGGSQSSLVPNE